MAIREYIVIGSGPGGGVLSHNLHSAGADVMLLEAGKFFRKDTFPRNEADTSAQLYWGGGLEYDKKARMAFLRSRLVGGSSIVYQCLFDRFDDIAFDSWKDESGVDFFNLSDMDAYYKAVEDFLDIYTFKREDFNGNSKHFVSSCEKVGYEWHYLHRGMNDCAVEKGNDCIACLGGCHRDSKQSSMATYIQKAESLGIDIVTETEVSHIESKGDTVKIYAKQNGKQIDYICKNVIICGGAFGSTGILLRSGLQQYLPALGKNFSSHPQFMSYGVFDHEINAHKGHLQSVASKDPRFRKIGFKLENVFAPPISTAMLFNVMGEEHQYMMKNYRRLQCVEVAIRDDNSGEIAVDKKGKLVVTKDLTDGDKHKRDEGLKAVKNIMEAGGAKKVVQSPLYFGLHLMGGCVMGVDGKRSVVTPEYNLHGFRNIFVADSSLYPNAPGINPSLTIMALAQRLSEKLSK